jgi:peptide/nickel transport system substrate-binding protein
MEAISRRGVAGLLGLGAAAAALGGTPAGAQATPSVLRFVPHADLQSLDPLGSTANIIKMHGFMVYDTLFGLDENFVPRPQMVETHTVSDDRLTHRFTLRPGLKFHDGAPVTAEDCVASIRRWGRRDAAGQLMMRVTRDLVALDQGTFELRLSEPYGLVLDSFAKAVSSVLFIMPKRIAETDAFTAITDPIGSGPFRFVREEWNPGSKVAYERFRDYVPRGEPPSAFAGGKAVNLDRVEWISMRDHQTAMGALRTGAIDVWEAPLMDLLPALQGARTVRTRVTNPLGIQGQIYFNHTQPPFDNVKARQAMFWLAKQEDYLHAVSGNPDYFRTCPSFFACGTPMANDVGSEPLRNPDPARARALFREAGWDFATPIVVLDPVDEAFAHPLTLVTVQAMRDIGLAVDAQAIDWATMLQRRNSTAPVSRGGWNMLHSYNSALGMSTPVWSVAYSGACERGLFGWPCDQELEDLRLKWALAEGTAAKLEVAKAYQQRAFDTGHHVPLGQWNSYIAHHASVGGILNSLDITVFWNMTKAR